MTRPVCAVIGAGPGIGAGVARRFADAGYALALMSRGGAGLDSLAATLRGERAEVTAAAIDARDPAGVARVLAAVGGIEVLVYNAYGSTGGGPGGLSTDDLVADFRINVASALAAAQAVIPGMRAIGRGSILFTGGGLALHPMANYASLSIGKAGLRSLAFSLAEELRPAGIRVGTVTVAGAVAPGTAFDPERIAQRFFALHQDREQALGVEIVFDGT